MGRGAGPGGDPTITHERSTWHRVESANRVGRVTRRRGSRKGTVTGCRVRETWWQRASNYDGSCDEIRAMSGMPLTTELEALFRDHNSHGSLTADATIPGWNGYLLTAACPCGVVLERWITPEDAELNLLRVARMN